MVKKKTSKTLSFPVTTKQYADFWYAAELLGESDKKRAFIKMIEYIRTNKRV